MSSILPRQKFGDPHEFETWRPTLGWAMTAALKSLLYLLIIITLVVLFPETSKVAAGGLVIVTGLSFFTGSGTILVAMASFVIRRVWSPVQFLLLSAFTRYEIDMRDIRVIGECFVRFYTSITLLQRVGETENITPVWNFIFSVVGVPKGALMRLNLSTKDSPVNTYLSGITDFDERVKLIERRTKVARKIPFAGGNMDYPFSPRKSAIVIPLMFFVPCVLIEAFVFFILEYRFAPTEVLVILTLIPVLRGAAQLIFSRYELTEDRLVIKTAPLGFSKDSNRLPLQEIAMVECRPSILSLIMRIIIELDMRKIDDLQDRYKFYLQLCRLGFWPTGNIKFHIKSGGRYFVSTAYGVQDPETVMNSISNRIAAVLYKESSAAAVETLRKEILDYE